MTKRPFDEKKFLGPRERPRGQKSVALGAKYLGFVSTRSLKFLEKCISFAQFVYFLMEVCLLFNFRIIKFTIMFFFDICEKIKLVKTKVLL